MKQFLAIALLAIAFVACNSESPTPQSSAVRSLSPDSGQVALRVAFIYGDTVNANYKFLKDAEAELDEERKRIEERMRRKLQQAENRAQELQRKAPTMSQMQMQEAQLELQSLDIEMQQFQEKLASDFRNREVELQKDYMERVDKYLEQFNASAGYDMILNFQRGGNLIWINRAFDITDQVLQGLNDAYDAEIRAKASAK
jgi:outer membrane protein